MNQNLFGVIKDLSMDFSVSFVDVSNKVGGWEKKAAISWLPACECVERTYDAFCKVANNDRLLAGAYTNSNCKWGI